ncbi:hypothetical protein NKI50_03625 [Mesorhizobium sp. M0563]|uniref:hypothetical protein n=1 Tax=Mesorhizobium sp. M0563 TaxID=2956959 RepID=UPI0033395DB6
MTTTGKFDFQLTGIVRDGSVDLNPEMISLEMPTVQIFLRWHSTADNGAPAVINECRTEGEVDTNIQMLKDELDAVATRAKAALRREEARIAVGRKDV